jgi:hypothetical protein
MRSISMPERTRSCPVVARRVVMSGVVTYMLDFAIFPGNFNDGLPT